MTNPLNISPIDYDQVEELIHLVNSAYRGESSKKGWTTEAGLLDGLRTNPAHIQSLMQKSGATILAATDESGRLSGCVYLQQQGPQLYLGMLTVAPELQAKGIGKQLLQAAENFGREMKCASIIMTVIDVRHELIDWYQRNGFRLTGEIKPFHSDPVFGIPKQPLQFIVLEKKI